LLIILDGLVLIFVVYRLIFSPLQDSNDSLLAQKQKLQQQVSQMNGMVSNKSSYESQTKTMQNEMKTIFDSIPSNLTSEDEILYAYDLENKYDMSITSLSMPQAELAYTMNKDGKNSLDSGKLLYKVPVAIACNVSYAGIKDYLRELTNEKYSKSIDNVSLTFDKATGYLSGTFTVNMYYLLGSDREYVPQAVDGVSLGTDNIFGAASAPKIK
jgi:Tfp pilus assembly protein PilO